MATVERQVQIELGSSQDIDDVMLVERRPHVMPMTRNTIAVIRL